MDNKDRIFVCRCEEITLADIEKAILDGATTYNGVKIRTEAGKGLCQGLTCRKNIEQILRDKVVGEKYLDPCYRFPVRPINAANLCDEEV